MNATMRGICFLLLASIATAGVTISPGHPELLQQGILDAYNAGQKSVVIPAGVYQVPVASWRHLEFDNMSNFEIDARGATLVFQDETAAGIIFYNCDAIYFHGAVVYYATPPFSQGVVQAVAADGSSVDIQIDKGYPTNLDDPKYFSPNIAGHLFDSTTRWWKRNVNGDIFGTGTQRLGTDTFRIFSSYVGGAAVGDLIGLRAGVGSSNINLSSCSRMNLSDLTILNAPIFGIYELLGGGLGANTYTNISIRRGNRPPGAITDPLLSTSADGFHSTRGRTGPQIQNCSFESMADDGIAVHGVFSWVMEGSGNTLIISDTVSSTESNFRVGDTLQLIDQNDQPSGQAIVTGVTLLPAYTNTMKSARQSVIDFTVGPYYQITLDHNVTAGFDYLAGNPGASGAGFVLLNNTIRNHNGRGIIVKGNNGTIQGNVIDGSTLDGIKAGPEFWWGEAGYVSNLVIKANTINNVGYWAVGTAGILIAPDPTLTTPGGYQNITIDGNTFSNFDVPAIFLGSASGVTIANNFFTNLQNAVPFNPNYLGQNVLPGTLVFIAQSTGVQFQGNTLSQLGPVNAFFVEALPSASVSGVAYVTPVASSDADFSGTQGTSGWNYGYFASGNVNAFTLLPTYDIANARWQHITFGPPWTALWSNSGFHPNGSDSGGEEWATRRWTSTLTGAATILGHLAKTDTSPNSPGVYGRIYVNHELVYQHFLQGTDGIGVDYSFNISLKSGDTIDFALAPNGVEFDDSTRFSSSILSIPLLGQTIAFPQPANVTVGALPFTLTATATSALAVAFTPTTPGICTASGSTVTIVAAGTCSITANQAGNTAYAPAIPVTQSFIVNPSGQTITFGALGNALLGTAPFVISATASSGLPVSFTSTTQGVCTVSFNSVWKVTTQSTGTCSIIASQSGNANYLTAANVTQSFTINPAGNAAIGGANINYAFTWSGTTPVAAPPVSITSTPSGVTGLELGTSGSCAWLNASLSGGATPASINTSFNSIPVNTLLPGTYVCNLTVSGSGASSAQLTATLTVSAPSFFASQESLGSGVFYLQFPNTNPFGYFTYLSATILYHYDLGYEAVIPATDSANGVYLYDLAGGRWWYTSPDLFPYLYDFTLNSFIYYFPSTANPGHYTTSPRYFSNLTTGKIFTM